MTDTLLSVLNLPDLVELCCTYLIPKHERHNAINLIRHGALLFWRDLVDFEPSVATAAAQHGYLHIVKQLYEQGFRDVQAVHNPMNAAAGCGHLHVVEWLHKNTKCQASVNALNRAAGNGYLDVVRFLHTHRHEGCTEYAMDSAAENGHLDVVKFLNENRTERNLVSALRCAVQNGHLSVVQYLHRAAKASELCETDMNGMFICAVENGHLSIVQYLGPYCRYIIRLQGLEIAIAKRWWDIWIFLTDQQLPYSIITRTVI